MKLINGTEIIDNSPNEKAGELAEAIYDDVLFILDIEHKCIQDDEDGNTSNTEYGQDLFNGIYDQCMAYFERESIKPQSKEPQYLYVYEDSFYSNDENDTRASTRIMNKRIKEFEDNYIGKIKLEE